MPPGSGRDEYRAIAFGLLCALIVVSGVLLILWFN